MFRFIYVIMMNVFRAPYMIPKMRYMAQHPEKYSEEQRYQMVTHMIHLMQRSGRISTVIPVQRICQKRADISCTRIIRESMTL